MLQVAEEVLHSAPCAVACQLLLHAAPPTHWPAPESSGSYAVGDVAEAAALSWADRNEDATAAQEARHEGMLTCAGRGWPWFAVGRAATQVLTGAGGGSAEGRCSGSSAAAGGNEVAAAAERVLFWVQLRMLYRYSRCRPPRGWALGATRLWLCLWPCSRVSGCVRALQGNDLGLAGGKASLVGPLICPADLIMLICMQAMHLAQVGDRHVSQLAGPTDLRHGIAAAAALLATVAPASELWRAAAPATKSRKGGKTGAAAAALATPALAATFRTILRLLHACVQCYRTAAVGRHDMLGVLRCGPSYSVNPW